MHGHTLAAVGVLPLIVLFVADLLRRPRRPRRQVIWVLVGTSLIVAAGLVPFFVFELRHDFAETRAIVNYMWNGATAHGPSGESIRALPVIAWRILAWPVSGNVSAAPLSALPAVFFTVAALTIAATGTAGVAKQFGRWAMATTVWAVVALTLAAPNLGVIHSGLPNDQYHAWLDPIILAAIGVAAAWLWGARSASLEGGGHNSRPRLLEPLSIVSMPPFTSARGGWPSAAEAADRIRAVTDDHPTAVTGVYKTGAAVEFPLRRAGSRVVDPSVAEFLVVTCDPLFESAVGIPHAADRRKPRVPSWRASRWRRRGTVSPMVHGDTSASSTDGDIRLPCVRPDSGVTLARHGKDFREARRVNLDWALTPAPKHSLRSDSSTNQFRPLIVGVICGTSDNGGARRMCGIQAAAESLSPPAAPPTTTLTPDIPLPPALPPPLFPLPTALPSPLFPLPTALPPPLFPLPRGGQAPSGPLPTPAPRCRSPHPHRGGRSPPPTVGPLPTPTALPLPTPTVGPLPTPTVGPLPTPTVGPLPTPTALPSTAG